VGLYGLTASLVGQRTREMGIRAALGANSGDLLRLLMWDSLRPVVVGLTLGAMTALAISRVVATTLLFGVSPQDPLAFAGAATILLAAATLAVIVPTRRGSSVDAAVVLRQ
ncbi:MAG TPA: FtsX-like permease family protein, partial [Vicinamibacterales bacterium]